jgi:hypothetical protein
VALNTGIGWGPRCSRQSGAKSSDELMVDLEATADFTIAQTGIGWVGEQLEKPDLQIAEGSSICLQHRTGSFLGPWVARAFQARRKWINWRT